MTIVKESKDEALKVEIASLLNKALSNVEICSKLVLNNSNVEVNLIRTQAEDRLKRIASSAEQASLTTSFNLEKHVGFFNEVVVDTQVAFKKISGCGVRPSTGVEEEYRRQLMLKEQQHQSELYHLQLKNSQLQQNLNATLLLVNQNNRELEGLASILYSGYPIGQAMSMSPFNMSELNKPADLGVFQFPFRMNPLFTSNRPHVPDEPEQEITRLKTMEETYTISYSLGELATAKGRAKVKLEIEAIIALLEGSEFKKDDIEEDTLIVFKEYTGLKALIKNRESSK